MKKNNNIQDILNTSERWLRENPQQFVQFNISDHKKLTKEFIEFCLPLCSEVFCDELDCRKSFQRQSSDKSTDWILQYHKDSIGCGIKWTKYPIGKFFEWEKWENGYLELFTRICHKSGVDYFIFGYIQPTHLKYILKEFKDELIIPI